MGNKKSTDFAFSGIVYNKTCPPNQEDSLEYTDEFARGLLGAPVTIEHGYEEILDLFQKVSRSLPPEERIRSVADQLDRLNYTIGDVTRAEISKITGSLLVDFSLRDTASAVLAECGIRPHQVCGLGLSLTHGISPRGLHPIEVALTSCPQRPGCRVIMALNQPDKGKLAEVMGKLSPAAREKIEHALANSQLSPVLNEIPQDLKAQLLAALPHEFLMEQMTAMMDHARNPSSEPAPTPIPSSASATPTGGNNLTLSGHQASMIANVLKNIINTTTGADADAGGDLSGLSQGEQMAVLAYSANVLTKGRKREGDHNDYQQNQQQQQQPQKRPRTLDTSSRQPSRLEMLASGPPEFTQGSHF